MKALQVVGVAVALEMSQACGTSADMELAENDFQANSGLEEIEALSSDDDTETRVRLAFTKLRAGGKLHGPGIWKAKAQPVGSFNRMDLYSDTQEHVSDGYEYIALIPSAHDVTRFYIERTGGVAGWKSIAGPFALSEPVKIGELMANKVVTVHKGELIIADLPYDAEGGYAWEATALPTLPKPHQLSMTHASAHGDVHVMRFAWPTDDAQIHAGDAYTLRFSLKHPADAGAEKSFIVAVNIR